MSKEPSPSPDRSGLVLSSSHPGLSTQAPCLLYAWNLSPASSTAGPIPRVRQIDSQLWGWQLCRLEGPWAPELLLGGNPSDTYVGRRVSRLPRGGCRGYQTGRTSQVGICSTQHSPRSHLAAGSCPPFSHWDFAEPVLSLPCFIQVRVESSMGFTSRAQAAIGQLLDVSLGITLQGPTTGH